MGDASAGIVTIGNITLTNWTAAGSCANIALQTNPSSLDLNTAHQVKKSLSLSYLLVMTLSESAML